MKRPDWKLWLNDKEECKAWLNSYLKKKMLRKSANESMLHIKKADHNLHIANWIIEKHKDEIPEMFGTETFYDWVMSMYYYATYHAALALMNREGYTSKNHSGTLCFLIFHHFHTQQALEKEDVELIAASLNKEDIEVIGSSKELREKANYGVHEKFEEKLIESTREEVVTFVNKIKTILEQKPDEQLL